MKLSKLYIDNFRNLKKVTISLSDFEVLVGENNIGKTNIMQAINKVLNFGKNPINFNDDDFNSLEEPVIIELIFSNFNSSKEEIIFLEQDNIRNPKSGDVIVRLRAEWDEKIGDFNFSLNFIRKDLPEDKQEIKASSNCFKNIIYYYIPTFRDIKTEKALGKILFKIIKSFVPYQIMPIPSLKKKTIAKVDSLLNKIENIKYKELKKCLMKLKSTIEKVEEITKEEMKNLIDNLETIKNKIEDNNKIDEGQILVKSLEKTIELLNIVNNRIYIQKKLNILKKEFKELFRFEELEDELNKVVSEFLANEVIKLETISARDVDFVKRLNIEISEHSLLKHGSGYQSILNLILKLFRYLYQVIKRRDVESKIFIIAIEEPESHLHPHLQRHLIKALINIQKEFFKKGTSIQFMVSTHSPFIITPLSFNNLTFLRPGKEKVFPYTIKIKKKKFIKETIKEFNLSINRNILKKKKQMARWLDQLFYDSPEIFFSRCVIIGEGETEQGAIPILSEKIGISLDHFGISFLNGKGDELIYPLKLLIALKTNWILIIDKDKKKIIGSIIGSSFDKYIFSTIEKAFEKEILSESPLPKVLQAIDEKSSPEINQDRINQLTGHYHYLEKSKIESLKNILTYIKNDNLDEFKNKFVLDWLIKEKGLSLGRILAELLKANEIPEVFVSAIKKAAKISCITSDEISTN